MTWIVTLSGSFDPVVVSGESNLTNPLSVIKMALFEVRAQHPSAPWDEPGTTLKIELSF